VIDDLVIPKPIRLGVRVRHRRRRTQRTDR
jgi:hypothetical protein